MRALRFPLRIHETNDDLTIPTLRNASIQFFIILTILYKGYLKFLSNSRGRASSSLMLPRLKL